MDSQNYHEQEWQKNTLRLRQLQKDLPAFTNEFFRSIAQSTSVKTRVGYAYDLKLFFYYLLENKKSFEHKTLDNLTSNDLNQIDADDIDEFMEYVTYYTKPDPDHPLRLLEFKNDEKGKARKLAAIRSMYKFFYKRKKVISNPAAIVESPKIHDKKIVRLEPDELANLLDEVEFGQDLTDRQKVFHAKSQLRDLAIVTTLVGTGMRVSECVGINVSDIDFHANGVKITRKGGNQVVLYFGDEVRQALLNYLEFRDEHPPKNENDEALFLSNRGTRITVRAVQNLVKKYSRATIKLKNITPHKLRSTYGTNLYRETGDIYLVADVLGHADVNTTKKHYAEIEEDRRKSAAKYIKLRKE